MPPEHSLPTMIGVASLTMIVALTVVGAVSHGLLRHFVQTVPLWAAVYLGLRGHPMAKWAALPTYLFWLFIMSLIWMYLLGVASIASGDYSPVEVAMTILVGVASAFGTVRCLAFRSRIPRIAAALVFAGALLVQIGAFALSLQPGIADR